MDRETITVKDFLQSDKVVRQKIKNLTYENTQLEQWDNTLLLIGADKYISRRRVREAIDKAFAYGSRDSRQEIKENLLEESGL